eukprot:3739665-Pyramimonas_sp.AAC.2
MTQMVKHGPPNDGPIVFVVFLSARSSGFGIRNPREEPLEPLDRAKRIDQDNRGGPCCTVRVATKASAHHQIGPLLDGLLKVLQILPLLLLQQINVHPVHIAIEVVHRRLLLPDPARTPPIGPRAGYMPVVRPRLAARRVVLPRPPKVVAVAGVAPFERARVVPLLSPVAVRP